MYDKIDNPEFKVGYTDAYGECEARKHNDSLLLVYSYHKD